MYLEDGWLRCTVCNWILGRLLLVCEPLLHIVLPGCSVALQQLFALLCAEQLRWLVRRVVLLLYIWIDVLQDLQESSNSTVCTKMSHAWYA